MNDPTTPAAATPAVLPLSAERQKHVLRVCARRGDVDYCDACFDEWPCRVALLGMLDAARADLAEFARQTREAQASMMAAIRDKEQERQAREQAEHRAQSAHMAAAAEYERYQETEAALQAERNRRRWAETRASHWRRQEDLVMIRLAQRSNELGRTNLAHRTALAQERQAREQAERERDEFIREASDFEGRLERVNRILADERARGERLAEALASLVAVADAYVQDFENGDKQDALFACLQNAATVLLAAPVSPAAEPADQTAAQAQGE